MSEPRESLPPTVCPRPSAAEEDSGRWRAQYAELATLAGGLAHEIRNPLSTISLNLELLQEELEEGGTPRERRMLQKLAVVQRECGHLEQILEDFLQFARSATLTGEACSLNDVVREFVEGLKAPAAEQQVEVIPHLAAELPLVDLDQQRFRQVLHNLVRNALQAMPQGGRLEFCTYPVEGTSSGGPSSTGVMLELIDNGVGMDARTQARMFDAFFSTKPGGSGLGLPTAQRIVAAHGGTMTCESEPGKGTRFRISLPASHRSA